MMDAQTITKKAPFEHDMLAQISKALSVVLHWRVDGDDISRNLSSVRFVSQSFHWHLERLMATEDTDGYLDAIAEIHPEISRSEKLSALRQEHEQFRVVLDALLPRFDRLGAVDHAEFDRLCAELFDVLLAFDEHSRKEVRLLPEVVLEDESLIR